MTPLPVDDVLDELDLAENLIHLIRHDTTDDPDSAAALALIEQLIDGLIWDLERGDLAVGRCQDCDKVHIWRPAPEPVDD